MTVVTCSGSGQAAAAEDAFAMYAVAVVDAVADLAVVALAARPRRRAAVPESWGRPSRSGSRGTSALRRVRCARIGPGRPVVAPHRRCERRREDADQRQGGAPLARLARVVGVDVMICVLIIERCDQATRPPVLTGRRPGPGGVAHRAPVGLYVPVAALLAGGLLIAWLLVDPRTPDLAAQVYRLGLFERAGLRRVGRALVRGPRAARLQPAVPAARLAAGHARARGVSVLGVGGAVRAARARPLRPGAVRARWGVPGSRWRPSGTSGSGG